MHSRITRCSVILLGLAANIGLPSGREGRQFRPSVGGAAASAVALNLHNARVAQKYTADQLIALMRPAEPGARKASPKAGDGLRSFCDCVGGY